MTAPCGTLAAERAHRRRGERPCKLCRDARNAYERARRDRRPKPGDDDVGRTPKHAQKPRKPGWRFG